MRNRLAGGLMVACILAASTGLWANPVKDPKRLVNGQTVSLIPLFQWWTNHTGGRPLTAWVHLTGRIVGTNAWGWIIEAQLEHGAADSGNRVVLRHPPLADQAEFERLRAELKALSREHDGLAADQATLAKESAAVKKQQSAYRKEGLWNRNLAREDKVLKVSENESKAELKPVDQQISALNKQLAAFPRSDRYEVDCFALDTGQQYGQLRLFDHGSALR